MAKNTCSVVSIFGHDWDDLVHLAFKGDRFYRPDRSLLRHNLNAGSIQTLFLSRRLRVHCPDHPSLPFYSLVSILY